MRAKTKPKLDKAMFSKNSRHTKTINVKPMLFRGGIRL